MSQVAWPLAEHICTAHHIEVILSTGLKGAARVSGSDPEILEAEVGAMRAMECWVEGLREQGMYR